MSENELENSTRQTKGYASNSDLRQKALSLLKGQWLLCVGVTIVYFVLNSAASGFHNNGFIISLIVGGPLTLGVYLFFLKLVRGKDVDFTMLFDGFKRFATSFLAYLLMTIFVILWSLLLIVPGIIAAFSYSMTFFIIADDESIDPQSAIKKSKAMMEGHKMKLFNLSLGFLGWALLCLLTAGIGFLWLFPYMAASFALFYEDVRGSQEEV